MRITAEQVASLAAFAAEHDATEIHIAKRTADDLDAPLDVDLYRNNGHNWRATATIRTLGDVRELTR